MRFILIGIFAVLILVVLDHRPYGLSPDAYDHSISNKCFPDGHQEFKYAQVDGKVRTLKLGKCVIKGSGPGYVHP